MNKLLLSLYAILVCAFICTGQTQNDKTTADPGSRKSRNGNQSMLAAGTSLTAQLQKTLDVNNARVGDEVVLKTTQSIRADGEVIVPKGSTLIGRVTDVKRRTKENVQSQLSVVFDQLRGRELSMPLNATIVSITNVAARATADDSLMTDVSGSSQTSGSTRRQSSGGGGLLGGVGNTVGGLVNTTTQTVGSVAGSATQTAGTTTGSVVRTVNGLTISTEASGSANSTTTLSSPNKNLRFEKGSTFHLRVAN